MDTWIPIGISILALVVSLVSLWRSFLSPFKLKVSFDAPTFTLYKITPKMSGGTSTWWIPSFDMGFTFYNIGSQVGEITDIRLSAALKNEKGEIEKVYPFFATWVVDYPTFNRDAPDRFKWLDTSMVREWYPMFLTGNSQQAIHLVLESDRWEKRFVGTFELTLEIFTSENKAWTTHATYRFPIFPDYFDSRSTHTVANPKLSEIREGYGSGIKEQRGAPSDYRGL
jgi:hypothetical protein